ncbi:A disintegrin and metalloproteinase with thrombospondin motifs 18, partial [Armadillidium nasatum]
SDLRTGGKSSVEVITPTRVNANGNFLSHDLSHRHVYNKEELLLHRRRRRRDAEVEGVGNTLPEDADAVLHYALSIQGEKHMIRVEPNHIFLAPHAVVERRSKSNSSCDSDRVGSVTSQLSVIGSLPRCHYIGHLVNQTKSKVALSTCDGLKGFLKTEKGEFLIEPVKGHKRKNNEPHPHKIYRKQNEHISRL